MDVRLVGPTDRHIGHVIPITGAESLIGRADDCHCVARSDVISRYHCTILVKDSFVIVRDSSSGERGTFVNGRQVMGEQVLKQETACVSASSSSTSMYRPRKEPVESAAIVDRPDEAGGLSGAGNLDLSDWLGKEDSSGTVLGCCHSAGRRRSNPTHPPMGSENRKMGIVARNRRRSKLGIDSGRPGMAGVRLWRYPTP